MLPRSCRTCEVYFWNLARSRPHSLHTRAWPASCSNKSTSGHFRRAHSMATNQQTHFQPVEGARNMIEESVGKENLDLIEGFLRTTYRYARRHPVRIGITVVALGLLGSWLASSKKPEYLH